MLRIVARVSAVEGLRSEPEPRRDHLRRDAFAGKAFTQFLRFLADLRLRFDVDVRHRVVVVKHHRVETELLKLGEFPVEGGGRPDGRAVWVLAFSNVPRTEAKPVGSIFSHTLKGPMLPDPPRLGKGFPSEAALQTCGSSLRS